MMTQLLSLRIIPFILPGICAKRLSAERILIFSGLLILGNALLCEVLWRFDPSLTDPGAVSLYSLYMQFFFLLPTALYEKAVLKTTYGRAMLISMLVYLTVNSIDQVSTSVAVMVPAGIAVHYGQIALVPELILKVLSVYLFSKVMLKDILETPGNLSVCLIAAVCVLFQVFLERMHRSPDTNVHFAGLYSPLIAVAAVMIAYDFCLKEKQKQHIRAIENCLSVIRKASDGFCRQKNEELRIRHDLLHSASALRNTSLCNEPAVAQLLSEIDQITARQKSYLSGFFQAAVEQMKLLYPDANIRFETNLSDLTGIKEADISTLMLYLTDHLVKCGNSDISICLKLRENMLVLYFGSCGDEIEQFMHTDAVYGLLLQETAWSVLRNVQTPADAGILLTLKS